MSHHIASFIVGILESGLIVLLNALSVFLRKLSIGRWEKWIRSLGNLGGIKAGGGIGFEPGSFKSIRLESGHQSGFPGDNIATRSAVVSLPQWAKEVSPFLANQLSSHTRRAYEKDLKQFFEFLASRQLIESFLSLRPEHIILYRKALEEGRISEKTSNKPLAKSTINRKLAVVKSFLSWLKLNRVVSENPAELVKGFPQSQESKLQGLSDEEARKMLEATHVNSPSSAMHCAVLHLLLYLGLRKAELIDLKVGDWDSVRGVEVLRVRGKGHRVRILPLTERLRLVLAAYLHVAGRSRDQKEEPLFIPTKNPRGTGLMKSLNPHAITYIVARYAKKVGVLKKISPHSCRATCISNALDRKASQRSVQSLAGWSTPLMIQRYDKRREDLGNSAAYQVDYGEPAVVAAGA